MRKFVFGLRFRLMLLIVLAVLPSLGLILYAGLEGWRQAPAHAREEALRATRLIAADQERSIDAAHQLLVALAQMPQVRSGNAASHGVF